MCVIYGEFHVSEVVKSMPPNIYIQLPKQELKFRRLPRLNILLF